MNRFVLGMVCGGLVLVANPAFAGAIVTATISGNWQNGVPSGPDIQLFEDGPFLGIQQFRDNEHRIIFSGSNVIDQPTGQTFVLGTLSISTSALASTGGFNTVDLVLTTDSLDPAFQGPSTISMKITVEPGGAQPGDDPTLFEFAGHPELGGLLVPGLSSASVEILGQFNSIDLVGFGATTGSGALVSLAPEPATASMLLVALCFFGRRALKKKGAIQSAR
jgi:hypothetical protein